MGASSASLLVAPAVAVALAGLTVAAHAQPRRAPVPGTVETAKKAIEIAPPRGFVDDPMTFDGAGGRLLYVNTDAGDLVNLELVDLTQKGAKLATVDLSKLAPLPEEVHIAAGGDQFVVIYRTASGADARKAAVLIDSEGKVKRRFGPAEEVAYLNYDGTPAVATYLRAEKSGRKGLVVRHTVEVRALATGKRLGKKVTLDADESGRVDRLGFRIEYWRDGHTRAYGTKEGTWDRKEDQRSPDKFAVYDVPAKTFARIEPIADVMKHAEMSAVERGQSSGRFAYVPRDRSGVVVHESGAARSVELAEPFSHYEPKSLAYQAADGGGLYLSLTIDPVHPDAVARKKAAAAWTDLYYLAPGAAKAQRLARLMAPKRGIRWRASKRYWAVLEKHVGFSRGGKTLTLYELEPSK